MSKTTQDGADLVEQLRLKSSILNSDGLIAKAAAELSRLRTENERYREALEELAAPAAYAMPDADRVQSYRDVARDALKEPKATGGQNG